MTPLEFLSFRDRLESGSGFQSFQFRELECVLGNKNPKALDRYPVGSAGRKAVEQRLQDPTLLDAFLACVNRNGHKVAERRVFTAPSGPTPPVQPVLIPHYR